MPDTIIYLLLGIAIGVGACAGVTIAAARKAMRCSIRLASVRRERNMLARLAGSLAVQRDQWRAVCLRSSDDLAALLHDVEVEWPETLEIER